MPCHTQHGLPLDRRRFASGQASTEEIKERQARSMADPEVQSILKDPIMQQVLRDFQVSHPSSRQGTGTLLQPQERLARGDGASFKRRDAPWVGGGARRRTLGARRSTSSSPRSWPRSTSWWQRASFRLNNWTIPTQWLGGRCWCGSSSNAFVQLQLACDPAASRRRLLLWLLWLQLSEHRPCELIIGEALAM